MKRFRLFLLVLCTVASCASVALSALVLSATWADALAPGCVRGYHVEESNSGPALVPHVFCPAKAQPAAPAAPASRNV